MTNFPTGINGGYQGIPTIQTILAGLWLQARTDQDAVHCQNQAAETIERLVNEATPARVRIRENSNPNNEDRKMKAMWDRGFNQAIDQFVSNLKKIGG